MLLINSGFAIILALGNFFADDRPTLKTVQNALRDFENRTVSRKKFEAKVPKRLMTMLQNEEVRVPLVSRASKDIAVILAYYGIARAKHEKVLIWYYDKWRASLANNTSVAAKLEPLIEDLPIDLGILYDKTRDAADLRLILNMQLDGASADIQAKEIERIWQGHAPDLALAASGSPKRVSLLGNALYFNAESDVERRRLRRDLNQLSTARDSRVSTVAREILRLQSKSDGD